MAKATPEEQAVMSTGKMVPDAATGSARNFTNVEADALNKAIAAGGSAGAAGFQAALARNVQNATAAAGDIGRSAAAMQAASPEVLAELQGIINPVFDQSATEIGSRASSKAQAFGDLQGLSTDFAASAQSALPIVQQQADAARALAEGQALAAATRGEFDLRRTLANAKNEELRLALERAEMERLADPDNLAAQIKNLGGIDVITLMAESINRASPSLSPEQKTRMLVRQGVPEQIARSFFQQTGTVAQDVAGQARSDVALQELDSLLRGTIETPSGTSTPLGGVLSAFGLGQKGGSQAADPKGLRAHLFGKMSNDKIDKLLTEGVSEEVPGGVVDEINAVLTNILTQADTAGETIPPAELVNLVALTAEAEGIPRNLARLVASEIVTSRQG